MPEISIVIPAYNAERTIIKTIESVLEQTFQDFEIIVINDGSKDKTVEIVESIKDERINIFSSQNRGLPTARNRGISHSTGEFIAFLDADDLWTKNKLEMQLNALKQSPEAGLAYSWTCFMDVDERGEAISFLPSPQYSFTGDVYQQLLIGDFIHSGSNTLIRSQAIQVVGEFEPTLKSCEDWDYWLRIAARFNFVVVPKYQILYRRTPGAMSSKVEVMKEASLIAIEKAYNAAPKQLQYLKKYTLTNFHRYCASLYLQHRNDNLGIAEARQHLLSAIGLQPKTLLDSLTQKLLIKLLFKQIFSQKISSYLIQLTKKSITIKDPRLQA
ncbi:glycosyltransferase family A protein [Rivularia sp. UHCC 0363]|uniref:glycosyltransferase family 2 protein n=1 Tax=Rivularia sp. UHCC 0363 TaxID=3110244 RepID=UPI002B1E9BC4|nr:glycosyltransferase family A protein [Rivularia sp. UHCC 0363]MEA5593800.1 glycosyltransferase family A protein [Rivularia sp. UHCC 0363]